MQVTTQFDLADSVYLKIDAAEGKLIKLIVEKINIAVESTELTVISYQVSNTAKFHNSLYNEGDLYTYAEAQARAETALQAEITEIEEEITEL